MKDGSIVEGRSGTLLRKPTQPDEGSGCYPRVRRGHRQALTFGGKYGTRAQWLCWIACGHKRAGSGPWLARDRRRPEQGASLVTRPGGERQGGTDRCASTVSKETGTEVPRENRSRWKGALAELLGCVGRGPERGRYLVGSVRNAGTERTWFVCNEAAWGKATVKRKQMNCCFCLWVGLPVSGAPLPKLEIRSGGAVVGVEGRWVVVREHIPAFVGPGTNIPGRTWEVEPRRLSASEPMSITGHRNGSDTWSKPGELRGRGVAQSVGLGRCRKLLHVVMINKTQKKNPKGGTAKGGTSK